MRLALCDCPCIFTFDNGPGPTQLTCVIWKISWHDAAEKPQPNSQTAKIDSQPRGLTVGEQGQTYVCRCVCKRTSRRARARARVRRIERSRCWVLQKRRRLRAFSIGFPALPFSQLLLPFSITAENTEKRKTRSRQNSRTADGADAKTVRAAAIEADLQFSVNKPNKPFGRRCVYAMCAKEHKANGRDLSAFSCT